MISLTLAPILVAAGTALADDCREAYAAVQYDRAATVCLAAVAEAPPEELGGLYRLAGLSLAAVGDSERARQAFVSLLALDPGASLERTISPKLRSPFEEARRNGGGVPVRLALRLLAPPRAGQPIRLSIDIEDGPARPVTRIQVAGAQGEPITAQRVGSALTLVSGPPARAGQALIQATALDRFGGRLAAANRPFEVLPTHPPRPVWLSWKLGTGAAAALTVVAAGVGLYSRASLNDARSSSFADEAGRELSTARRTAYVADVGFALAAAGGIAAAYLFATDPGISP